MDRTEFERSVAAEGYEIVERHMEKGTFNPEHAHEFDARLLLLEGEITIGCEGEERTYRPGDSCSMSAGRRHSERVGPEGVRYLAALRQPSAKVA